MEREPGAPGQAPAAAGRPEAPGGHAGPPAGRAEPGPASSADAAAPAQASHASPAPAPAQADSLQPTSGAPSPGPSTQAGKGGPDGPHDASRRAFFREFGRQAVTTVGQVAGMADMVGRGPTRAAASLLGLGLGTGGATARKPVLPAASPSRGVPPSPRPATPTATPAAAPSDMPRASYSSPYRWEERTLRLVDQRALPDRIEELTCRRGSDVVFYLRVGAARGGPLMAQLAACALAIDAFENRERAALTRESEARRLRRSLVLARPSSRLIGWAVARMEAVSARFGGDEDGVAAAEALRAKADAIGTHIQFAQADIAGRLAQLLPRPEDRPLSVLLHGSLGALATGTVGTAVTALARLAGEGRELTVRVTEGRPLLDGARLTSWELGQAGISHQVLPDAAAAWLLASEPVDAVIVGAEWIAANGDVAAVAGSRAIAFAAAGGSMDPARPVPLLVTALAATLDPAIPDGASIPSEMRPGRELTTYQSGFTADRLTALNPATDVIPARLVGCLVTEKGVLTAPGPQDLARLWDEAHPGEPGLSGSLPADAPAPTGPGSPDP